MSAITNTASPLIPPALAAVDAGPTLSELVDGQLTFFDVAVDAGKVSELNAALKWLQARWSLRVGGGLDVFPYTAAFDRMFDDFGAEYGRVLPLLQDATDAQSKRNALWLTLLRLRKNAKLKAAVRRIDSPPVVYSDHEFEIVSRHVRLPPSRRERERLPYTIEFDTLFSRFNFECHRRGCPNLRNSHGFWRLIVAIMKSERLRIDAPLFPDAVK